MDLKKLAPEAAATFAIVFIVSLVVSYLYGLIAHGAGFLDWENSARFAIILGIALPWVNQRQKK